MNILPVDRAENNLIDAEILRRDALDDLSADVRVGVVRVQTADALYRRRCVEFDAAFEAALSGGSGEVAA